MNWYASTTAAALLLAAACTAGAWQGWALGQHTPEGRHAAYGGQTLEPVRVDMRYPTQYAGDGAADTGFDQGFYGWSYLLASPVAAPLATAWTAVRDEPR